MVSQRGEKRKILEGVLLRYPGPPASPPQEEPAPWGPAAHDPPSTGLAPALSGLQLANYLASLVSLVPSLLRSMTSLYFRNLSLQHRQSKT